ncbi:MAG: hypothetical protein V4538_17640 [Bacteroidota bacterium]
MQQSANDNMILAMIHNSIARNYLSYVRHEVAGDTKEFINRLIKRCEANETDTIARMTCDENREVFVQEIRKGDTMQFSCIMLQIFSMDQDKRDMVENLINLIHKGEEIKCEAV